MICLNYQELLSFVQKNPMDLQNANASIFAADYVFQQYVESDSVTGVVFEPIFGYHVTADNFYQIIADEKIRELAKSVYNKSLKSMAFFKKVYSTTVKLEKQIDADWKKFGAIEKLSDKKLLELFNAIAKNGGEWWRYTVIGEDKGRIIEEEIAPLFEKNYSLSKVEAIQAIAVLSHPKEEAIFTGERKLIAQIALLIEKETGSGKTLKNKKIAALVKKYQKDYFFSKSSFLDRKVLTPQAIIEEAEKELKEKGVLELKLGIEKIDLERGGIKKRQKELLAKIKPSAGIKKNILFATMLTEWLDFRKRGMMKQFFYLFFILHEVAERKKVPYLGLCNMTADEIREIISGKKEFDYAEMERRQKNIITVHEKGMKTRIFYDADAVRLFNAARQFHHSNQQLKGTVASLGKEKLVRGKARIVIDPAKDEFNEGEVLVASMTRIEFVPLMKKAKAIITDEGGIACHAAIVSRELGVPCVIGTKNATKILKNGDLVEVNLSDGLVKKV